MGLPLQQFIIDNHREKVGDKISHAINPTVKQGNLDDPLVTRDIVEAARRIAVAENLAYDNPLISKALQRAGIYHIDVAPSDLSGPNILDDTTHPVLFAKASTPVGQGNSEIVTHIAASIDATTPDAFPTDRFRLLYFFTRMTLGLHHVEFDFTGPLNEVTVTGKKVEKVKINWLQQTIAPDAVEWPISPYENALSDVPAYRPTER